MFKCVILFALVALSQNANGCREAKHVTHIHSSEPLVHGSNIPSSSIFSSGAIPSGSNIIAAKIIPIFPSHSGNSFEGSLYSINEAIYAESTPIPHSGSVRGVSCD